jgi:hypothetical protein
MGLYAKNRIEDMSSPEAVGKAAERVLKEV